MPLEGEVMTGEILCSKLCFHIFWILEYMLLETSVSLPSETFCMFIYDICYATYVGLLTCLMLLLICYPVIESNPNYLGVKMEKYT